MRLLEGHNLPRRGALLKGHGLTAGGITARASVTIGGLTLNETHGISAQDGALLTAQLANFEEGATFTYLWRTVASATALSTAENYLVDADTHNEAALYLIVTPSVGDPVSSSVFVVRHVTPTEDQAANITGSLIDGGTLSATEATFIGQDVTATGEWQVSADGSTGWSDTDVTSLNIEVVEGLFYRRISVGENSGGPLVLVSAPAGPVGAAPTAPAQMDAPSLTVDSPSQITVTLADDPDNGGAAIDQYDVRWREVGDGFVLVNDVNSLYVLTALLSETAYEVQSRARNSVGIGAWSSSSSATTDEALPVFTAPSDGTIGFTFAVPLEEIEFQDSENIYVGILTGFAQPSLPFEAASIAANPAYAFLPQIAPKVAGNLTVGDVAVLTRGMLFYEENSGQPVRSLKLTADGVDVEGYTDIDFGDDAQIEIPFTVDMVGVLRLVDTADATVANSAAITVVTPVATHLTFTQHVGIANAALPAGSFTMPAIVANNASPNRTFELTISLFRGAAPNLSNVEINGVPAIAIVSTSNYHSTRIYKFKATVPTGTNIVVTGVIDGTAASEIQVQLYSAASDFTVVDTAANGNGFNETTIPLNMDNAAGDLRSVSAFFLNATANTFVGVNQDALITNGPFRTYIGLFENAPEGTDVDISATAADEDRRVAVGAVYRKVS